MISVEDALERILAPVKPLGRETIPLSNGAGRVLAADIAAPRSQPPTAVSAMDGYAVASHTLRGEKSVLKVSGESAAGSVPLRSIEADTAVRIFTGAPMPGGADTVIIQENVTAHDDGTITLNELPKPGANVRAEGVDFEKGQVCLRAGRRLTARDLSLAASLNQPWLQVNRQPKVGVLATGDELVRPGETPGEAGIISSTVYGLSAYISQWGGVPMDLGIAKDTRESLSEVLSNATDIDVLVTLGGASVGAYDLVQSTLNELGMKLDFWKIAMRPGKPLMFGEFHQKPVLGLPGNPVSAFVCALLFLQPALRKMNGDEDHHPAKRQDMLPLASAVPENGKRQDYMRARLVHSPRLEVAPFDLQDSSVVSIFANSDCLIVRPPHAPPSEAGDLVPILRLNA